MGSSASKFEGHQQADWTEICAKRVQPVAPGTSGPAFRDLNIEGFGANGISVTPDLTWPPEKMVRIAASEFGDLQCRFAVDRVRCAGLNAGTLNDLLAVYAQCPNARLRELHFARCETDGADSRVASAAIRAQNIAVLSDTEGAFRLNNSRGLGNSQGHRLFFLNDELIAEQARPIVEIPTSNHTEFDYLPMQDGTGKSVQAERKNWVQLRKGEQPPWRLYYADMKIHVQRDRVHATPDPRWSSWLKTRPYKLSNYLQYIDTEAITIFCEKFSDTTRQTLRDLISNLTVSQCLLKAKRITFTGGDYGLVTQAMFYDFIEPRKNSLEWVGFDQGCINVGGMRAALDSVYQEDKHRPYDLDRPSFAEYA